MPSPTPHDVVAALRQATGALHKQVEREMPLSKPDAGLREYAAHLSITLQWLNALSPWIEGFPDGPENPAALPRVNRIQCLEDDLADLSKLGVTNLPSVSDAPVEGEEASPAYRWGVCYVIEGSQLGGLVLERQLSASMPAFQIPSRYLGGSGVDTPLRWRRYLRMLRREVTEPSEIEAACRGALWAFGLIRKLAAEVGPWKTTTPS